MQTIGHYQIIRPIGEGAMGVVYEALDERLDRHVALKLMTESAADSRDRFWREARLAARINHPNICHIYDVGEHQRQPFLAMELLRGEPLASRIERGPMAPSDALLLVDSILSGLEALHAEQIVHRDLKPSNVFLVDTGVPGGEIVKLLDFGLARPIEVGDSDITQPGMAVGTPRYMAPEQWNAEAVGPPADLFAVAALLFELLTGRPAFHGDTPIALFRAIVSERPPALTGDSMVEAVDRVLHRALAKAPRERFPSASAMRAALHACASEGDLTMVAPVEVRTVTRLLVLPFDLLRPDEEIDFLSFALADAVTASLAGMHSLVVRSGEGDGLSLRGRPNLAAIAARGEVDAVLAGSLLRSGDRVRLVTRLLEVPNGTVLASTTEEATLDDIFRLQDELAEKVTQSLAIPLGERVERQERLDVPASGEAYEHYLRANDLATGAIRGSQLRSARELYLECLELDPDFAPAWARLGRVERLLAKYGGRDVDAEGHRQRAATAFDRALGNNPDLPIAHNLLTYHQIEELAEASKAMVRLLEQVAQHPDPDLYSGLVVACRFCGLLDASLAAHQQARRLDPNIPTSVSYTYYFLGDYRRAAEADQDEVPFMRLFALGELGEEDEAQRIWSSIENGADHGVERLIVQTLRSSGASDQTEFLEAARGVLGSSFKDPEGLFFVGRNLGRAGHFELALEIFEDIVARGFHCMHRLRPEVVFPEYFEDERFHDLRRRSEARSRDAESQFFAHGGERVLGVRSA